VSKAAWSASYLVTEMTVRHSDSFEKEREKGQHFSPERKKKERKTRQQQQQKKERKKEDVSYYRPHQLSY
jgi:prophage tail gpP-like protein